MAKKKAVRRENGRGTVEKTSNKKNERYFASLNSESSKRTVTSAYAYCSGLYDMPIRMIGPGHIRDAMETGYVIPTTGKLVMTLPIP